MKKLIVAIFICGTASGSFAKDCHVDHFNFVFGQDIQVHMDASSGKACFININAGASIDSGDLSQPASNGKATMLTPHRFGYQSKGGFSGRDHFAVALSGTGYVGRGRHIPVSGTTKIDVDVAVAP